LYLGTQPIISDIEVFREIYNGFPVLFCDDMTRLKDFVNREPATIDCKREIILKYNYLNFVSEMMEKIDYAI
jgi:hypothetical protein